MAVHKGNFCVICPRSRGLVVRAVACEARGPGFDSSSDQMVFSLLGYKEVGKNGSRHDKLHAVAYPCRKKFLAMPSSGELVLVQVMGKK